MRKLQSILEIDYLRNIRVNRCCLRNKSAVTLEQR